MLVPAGSGDTWTTSPRNSTRCPRTQLGPARRPQVLLTRPVDTTPCRAQRPVALPQGPASGALPKTDRVSGQGNLISLWKGQPS